VRVPSIAVETKFSFTLAKTFKRSPTSTESQRR
jgi:hypothetical protein